MAGVSPTMHDAHPFSSLWCFQIDNPCRRWAVVGRFATTPLATSAVQLDALGLDPEAEYLVFDFWAQKYLGRTSRRLHCPPLAPGHCQILALVPVKNVPQLLASSRHVSMDAVSMAISAGWQTRSRSPSPVRPEPPKPNWFHVPEPASR